MKKSLILLSICSAVLLTSCGTSSYYASSSFEDGIYYRPSKDLRAEADADKEQVQRLIEQTRQEAARFSDTIIIAGASNSVDIPYDPDKQYTILFDDQLESTGQLNINFNFDDWYPGYGFMDYYSYWDWRYWKIFGPSWYRWGWYDPWYWGWYDPWYGGWSWSFRYAWDCHFGLFGWHLPGYWGPGYWGPGYWGWYDPWYGPWGYPTASFFPTYHGKRDTGIRTGGLSGGRLTASGDGGNTIRDGGRQSRPTMSVIRGRGTATDSRVTASKDAVRGGRTFQASDSRINLGERYVSRGSVSSHARPASGTAGRTAYRNTESYRRVSGSASGFRRPAGTQEFRNPFENRSQYNSRFQTGIRTDYGTSVNRNSQFNRNTVDRRPTVNRNTYNNSTSRSFSTGRSVSRSTMSGGSARSYGGGSRSVRR